MVNDAERAKVCAVRSSAGSGKTYSLALRYLSTLVHAAPSARPAVPGIIAITFTNKAALEMRSRIIDWMKHVILGIPYGNSTGTPLGQILGRSLSPGEEEFLRAYMENNFNHILRHHHDFKVSTIDSFVHFVLKASAFRLGLPPDFDITTESGRSIDLALQECLQRIVEDASVRSAFDEFVENYVEIEGENVLWTPRTFLGNIFSLLWAKETTENRQLAQGTDGTLLGSLRRGLEKKVRSLSEAIEAQQGLKLHKGFMNALSGFSLAGGTGFKVSDFLKRPFVRSSMTKGSSLPDDSIEEAWGEIRRDLGHYAEYLSASRYSSYLRAYGIFKGFLRSEITFKKRVVLIEELNSLLRAVIQKQYIPEIYYTLAEQYRHFLIDEFQDTNHLQWENIGILAEEAVGRGGTLFLVGDKKQAIYRWRGGRAELVDDVVAGYRSRSFPVETPELGTNYRSSRSIVEFNNAVFEPEQVGLLSRSVLGGEHDEGDLLRIADCYSGSLQKFLTGHGDRGYVRVERLTSTYEEDPQAGTPGKDGLLQITGERFDSLIAGIRRRGVFRDGDIGVLVRRRNEADFIVKRLLEQGIAVDSESTVDVRRNPIVREMVDFLRFIDTPEDDLALAGFITGSIFMNKTGISREHMDRWLTTVRLKGPPALLYRSFERDFPRVWRDYFEHLLKSSGYTSLYEIIASFMATWDIFEGFPRYTPYFFHFLELVSEQEDTGAIGLNQFLDTWNPGPAGAYGGDETPFLLRVPEGTDAVKVLTVHKAKGLEFPVVVLPFPKLTTFEASDSREKNKYFQDSGDGMALLHITKQLTELSETLAGLHRTRQAEYLLDELNALYVAFTRPVRELYVLLGETRRQKNYLIDHLFGVEALAGYRKGDVIEVGLPRTGRDGPAVEAGVLPAPSVSPPATSVAVDASLGWTTRLLSKFEEPAKISKEHLHAKKRGDVIHDVLSLIKVLPTDGGRVVKEAVTTAVARHRFETFSGEIGETIERFFANPSFRAYFTPTEDIEVFTEREIVDPFGNIHKIDRLHVAQDALRIVEFKTGEEYREEHRAQVLRYRSLVTQIYPGRPASGHLLYIDEGKVVEV